MTNKEFNHIMKGPILFTVIIFYGFVMHFTRPWVKRLGPAWTELTSYAIGSLMVLSTIPWTMAYVQGLFRRNEQGESRADNIVLAILAMCISYGTVGIGVVVGWMVRPDEVS